MQACISHVSESSHQAVTACKLPSFQVHDAEKNFTVPNWYYPIFFLPLKHGGGTHIKGVTTLPHNYHAGRLRHYATKQRACNLDTPTKFHRDNSPWPKAVAPQKIAAAWNSTTQPLHIYDEQYETKRNEHFVKGRIPSRKLGNLQTMYAYQYFKLKYY